MQENVGPLKERNGRRFPTSLKKGIRLVIRVFGSGASRLCGNFSMQKGLTLSVSDS